MNIDCFFLDPQSTGFSVLSFHEPFHDVVPLLPHPDEDDCELGLVIRVPEVMVAVNVFFGKSTVIIKGAS